MTSLKEIFLEALEKYESISTATSPEDANAASQKALELFKSTNQLVANLDLFDADEDIDPLEDVSTLELPYLLVPAFLANLISSQKVTVKGGGESERLSIVKEAMEYANRFLSDMELFGLLNALDLKILKDCNNSAGNGKATLSMGPTISRDEKIAIYQEQKALEEKIKAWRGRTRRFLSNSEGAGDNEEAEMAAISSDEESVRAFMLDWIRFWILTTLDTLKSCKMEKELLEWRLNAASAEPSQPISASSSRKQPPITITKDNIHTFFTSDDQAEQIARLTRAMPKLSVSGATAREAILDRVFKPGHSMPTMTLDEFVSIEMERGNFLSGGGKVPAPVDKDEDSEETDAAIYKKRMDDEFKDGKIYFSYQFPNLFLFQLFTHVKLQPP